MQGNVQLVDAIFCDDVRQEVNGKFILVGVYQDTLLVKSFPAELRIFSWFTFKISNAGECSIEVRLRDSQNNILGKGKFETNLEENIIGSTSSLTVNVANKFFSNDSISLDFKINSGRWRNFRRLNIIAPEEE